MLNTTTAAQDAIVSVGGAGGFQVTSASNAVSGLLPGLTVNVSQVSASPVTVSVKPDGTQVATQVASLVSAANAVLTSISTDTAYDQSTNSAAALNGATSLTELSQEVLSLVGSAVGASGVGSDGTAGESAGLAITASGTITFNQTAFVTAYNANPSGVQSMFTEGGTFSPSSPTYAGEVSVAGATDETTPGAYSVSISQSAAQAVDTGSTTFAAPSSTLGAAESYSVTSGSSSATYAASAGESVANVISGLNSALAASGIGVSASLVGASGSYHVQLSTAAYGAGASFSLSASGADQLGLTTSGTSFAGADVIGTIDGQAATGVGQTLSLADEGSPGQWSDARGDDTGHHVGDVARHRQLQPGIRPRTRQPRPAVERHAERPDRRHHCGTQQHARERDPADRFATAAREHPATDAHDGVHQHGKVPHPAEVREQLSLDESSTSSSSSSSSGLSSLSGASSSGSSSSTSSS